MNLRSIGFRTCACRTHLFALVAAAATALPLAATGTTALDEWIPRSSPLPPDARVRGVAYGNDRFVAVAYADGHAFTSPDGTTWEPQNTGTAGTSKKLSGIAFGNGIFVAVGNSGHIRTTTDGVDWNPQDAGTTAHFNNVSFANDRFIATGDSGALLSSPDGVTWTPHNTATSNKWHSATYANGTYVAVGYRSPQAGRAAAGPILDELTLNDTGYVMYMNGVAYGAGKFVCVGYAGAAQTSTDGVQWTEPINASPGNWLRRIVYEAGHFVAVGESGIAVSPDGTNWETVLNTGFVTLEGIAFGKDTFVAVGQEGLILQSAPINSSAGIELTHPSMIDNGFQFEFNGEVGQSYEIEASTDLINWSWLKQVDCTSPTMTVIESTTVAPRFYRVIRP